MRMVATMIPAIGYVTCSHSDSLWRERVTRYHSPTMRNATNTPAIIRANESSVSSSPLLTGGGEGVLVSVVEGEFDPLSPSPSGVDSGADMGGFPPRGITEGATTGGVGVGVGTADT